jgi:hypothetical protein
MVGTVIVIAVVIILVLIFASYAITLRMFGAIGQSAAAEHLGSRRGGRRGGWRGGHGGWRGGHGGWRGGRGLFGGARPSWWRWGVWPGAAYYPWAYWEENFPDLYAYILQNRPDILKSYPRPSLCELCPYICSYLGVDACRECMQAC